LRIEDYFNTIREIIDSCPIVLIDDISYSKRGSYEGYIRGELSFVDKSVLHLREFIDVEITPERLMYAYQYIDPSDVLNFRYDNTGHHKKLGLPTYPHHKHQGSEDNVVPSKAPDLSEVLREIELFVQLP
jgi:hypothetical protein